MLLSALALFAGYGTSAQVVINEIMYHPPDDRDDLQWIELMNSGDRPVDLAGWSFKKGFRFSFTNALPLVPGGFIVVARDLGAFRTHYGTNLPALGDFRGTLGHGGERIDLADPTGRIVDSVEYDDTAPWPSSPDGLSSSLERIVASAPGSDPFNWAPSPLPPRTRTAGTPCEPNASRRTNLPPIIRLVSKISETWEGPEPLGIRVEVQDSDGVREVTLHQRSLPIGTDIGSGSGSGATASRKTNETAISMTRVDGDPYKGTYVGILPPAPPGVIVRYRVEAIDRQGFLRQLPHPDDARPSWSTFSGTITNGAAIPFAYLAQHGAEEKPGQSLRNMDWSGRRSRRVATVGEPTRGDATFVHVDPGASRLRVFDHVRITPRQGGWKLRLQKDQLLDGMSTVNVLFEYRPRYVLSEHMAYEVYRRAGVPTPLSGHWRVWYNGRPIGYHLYVEQPNSTFLRRVGLDPDGDLFKLIWYGEDLVGQHEKKNNPETGHAELVTTVETLSSARGADSWREIESRFAVDSFVNYYAVNMLIQNWDGFFNNYFLHRGPGATGKWSIIPWDEDKTWGDYDGASDKYDWYSMPLSFGMAGDQPKRTGSQRFFNMGGPHGGPMWWRHPGWFSGPLLANPEFRNRFKTRLGQLLADEFTPEHMEESIRRLENALEPEVRYRARIPGANRDGRNEPEPEKTDASQAIAQFRRHIDSFRRQVRFRREFLTEELARER